MNFTKKIQTQFEKAGWYKGRKDLEIGNLLKEKYNYPSVALNFMEEYGGLKVENTVNIKPLIIDFRLLLPELDLSYAMDYSNSEIGSFVDVLGYSLYYLGEYEPGNWFVCCDESGRTYYLSDLCYYVGSTIEKGIENILTHGIEDCIIYNEPTKSWVKRSEDFSSFIPVDFNEWVAEH